MKRVGKSHHRFRWSKKTIKLGFIAFYLIAIPTFIYFAMQPDITFSATAHSISIPAINLSSRVTELSLKDNNLVSPDTIPGVYHAAKNKTFVIGHVSTVFTNLSRLNIGDTVMLNDKTYQISHIETVEKSIINMANILKPESADTLIMMTCAGEKITQTDYTHRLIITAVRL